MAHPAPSGSAPPLDGTPPALLPGPGVVHIWRIPLTGPHTEATLAAAERLLDASELARAGRLRLPDDRHRWTTARVALRTVLSRYTGTPPDLIRLVYGRYGKPRLADTAPGGLRFSLSHSRNRALLAVCRGAPVGVDLEHSSAGPAASQDLDDLAGAVLAPAELRAYLRLPPALRRAALLCRWTGKEAVLKATGRGMTLSAARRLVVPEGVGTPRGLPGDWTLLRPRQDDGYTAALCLRGKDWKVARTDFTGVRAEDLAPVSRRGTQHRPSLPWSGCTAARHG